MTSRVMLFPSSGNHVDLYPEWDVKNESRKIEDKHRVRSGGSYTYKWGDYFREKFSLTDVNSSDACIINSWWNTNTDLLFTTDSGTTVNSVHIENKKTPLGQYMEPYDSLFKGTIELEGY